MHQRNVACVKMLLRFSELIAVRLPLDPSSVNARVPRSDPDLEQVAESAGYENFDRISGSE